MTITEALSLAHGDLVTHPNWEGKPEPVDRVDGVTFPEDPVVFFEFGGFWRSSRLTKVETGEAPQ